MRKIAIFLSFIIFYGLGLENAWADSPSLDSAFGNNGITITSFGSEASVSDSVLQEDGKLIVVGNTSNGSNLDWRIVRYNNNGQIDNTFGNNGVVSWDSNYGNDNIESVVSESNGKILVGGYSGPGYTWTLAQYNSNGGVDQGFGNNGFVLDQQGVVKHILQQSDGKILAFGYFLGVDNGGHDDIAIVRYNSNGSLDTTFGGSGKIIMPIGSSNDRGIYATVQSDGKILALGEYDAGGHDKIFLARFNQNGSLDQTFGNAGKTLTAIGDSDTAVKAVLTSDNKIIVTGSTILSGNFNVYVARFDNSGNLDLSFGTDGKEIIRHGNNNDFSLSLVLLPNGGILIGGYTKDQQTTYDDAMLRSFKENGEVDSSFGTDGFFNASLSSKSDEFIRLIRLSDGKIIAVGQAINGNFRDWVVSRFKNPYISTLPVPLLKQNDNAWGSQLYDSANLWSSGSTDISSYGCALTSAAMVFEFNGIKKLPNGEVLNPGTLNTWLKSQSDGYVRNGLVNWLALSRLSMQAKSNNDVNFDALEYSRIGHQDDAILATNLNQNISPILEEPGHFVVATGTDSANTSFFINDPFYSRTTLANSSYNKTYSSMGIYTPSHTNLSYMMLVVNPNVNVSLVDSDGDNLGKSFVQSPITDDVSTSTNSVGPLKIFYFQKPPTDRYTLKLSSSNSTSYTLDEYLYDKSGEFAKSTYSGDILKSKVDSYVINFDQNNKSNDSFNEINFEYIKNEITNDYHNKKITSFTTYMSLVTQLNIITTSHSTRIQKTILNNMIKTIKRDKKFDNSSAKQLIYDIQLLQSSF